jgi:hypothetical protein
LAKPTRIDRISPLKHFASLRRRIRPCQSFHLHHPSENTAAIVRYITRIFQPVTGHHSPRPSSRLHCCHMKSYFPRRTYTRIP